MRALLFILAGAIAVGALPSTSMAGGTRSHVKGKRARAPATKASCLRALDELGVEYRRVKRRGIAIGVRIRGPLGGVDYRGYDKRPLDIDCSLAVSLAVAGRFLTSHGIDSATYSSAYQIRNIRGTRRRSQHSFGLAIDVHLFSGEESGALSIKEDYEQGLGDEIDCIGQPATQAGAALREIDCQLHHSGLFRYILDPDHDAGHYNHFHIEARPWRERDDVGTNWRMFRPVG